MCLDSFFALYFYPFVTCANSDLSGIGVRYYGYYLSGNYVSEIEDHSNLTHQYLHADQFADTYQYVINHNMKIMVDVTQVFFEDEDPNDGDDSQRLRQDYQARWDHYKTRLGSYTNNLAAFYVADEPGRVGLSVWELQAAINALKANFPSIPTASIASGAGGDLGTGMFDWVGFDYYTNGKISPTESTPAGSFWARFKSQVRPWQRIILVPQAGYYYDSVVTAVYYQAGVEKEARIYNQIALDDPQVIAVTPFIWQQVGRFDCLKAVSANSQLDINIYKKFGHDVMKRASERYPPVVSPAQIIIAVNNMLIM
ncbi:MAG: hypothetical protein EOO52_12085 [Gammaproteobacteria bacterium]|nr:MAG: hypothetical protein EOO52_12085 [Gammaproteobacteria bacterium]